MSTSQDIEQFLNSIEAEGAREYYKSLIHLIQLMKPQMTENDGLACILVITSATIYFQDGTTIGIDDDHWLGTVGELAEAIAIIFKPINNRHIWWKVGFTEKGRTPAVKDLAKEFITRLRASKDILSVNEVLI